LLADCIPAVISGNHGFAVFLYLKQGARSTKCHLPPEETVDKCEEGFETAPEKTGPPQPEPNSLSETTLQRFALRSTFFSPASRRASVRENRQSLEGGLVSRKSVQPSPVQRLLIFVCAASPGNQIPRLRGRPLR